MTQSCQMRKTASGACRALIVIGTLAAAACTDKPQTLYQELGEKPGITRLVDNLFDNIVADPRLNGKFDNINVPRLKERFVAQFCVWSGGPCDYHGISMKGAHKGLGITEADFNAVVGDLKTALRQSGVDQHAGDRLLAVLGPMEHDIVTK